MYDTGIIEVAAVLKVALEERRTGKKILVLLDHKAVVSALQTGKTSSSIRATRVFNEVAQRVWLKLGGCQNTQESRVMKKLTEKLVPRYLTFLRLIYSQKE